MAAVGIVLAVLGAWIVVKLGPSGEADFSVTSNAPRAIVVPPDVLNSVDVPVRVTASRRDGSLVRLVAGPSADARAILAGSAVSTVSGVRYPAGALDLRDSGSGALGDIGTADVWRLSAQGRGSAELVVDQERAPETVVVISGDTAALKDVTMTLTWASRTWFFEALAAVMIGAMIAAFSLIYLWQGRSVAVRSDVSGTTKPEEAT